MFCVDDFFFSPRAGIHKYMHLNMEMFNMLVLIQEEQLATNLNSNCCGNTANIEVANLIVLLVSKLATYVVFTTA